MIPRKLSRTSNHEPPRFQLYQPGFNETNGCWIPGGWITLPKAEWQARKATHEKMYASVREQIKKQHYRNPPVAVADMTEAQKQAWQYFSGQRLFSAVRENYFTPVKVDMAGGRPKEASLKWLRRDGYKLPRWVQYGPKAKPVDQIEGLDIPADVIHENDNPIDTVSTTVQQNKQKMRDLFDASVKATQGPSEHPEVPGLDYASFGAQMACHQLIERELNIIREEYDRTKGRCDGVVDLDADRREYVEMRAKLKEALTNFDEWYEKSRKSHNECARINLDNSKGLLWCYVLPKFNEDGTHEPWGERDVPWGRND